MKTLTIDDLTFEDFSIIRSHMNALAMNQKIALPYDVFVQIALDKYNRGEYDIIKLKNDFVPEPDMFSEVEETPAPRKRRTITAEVKQPAKPVNIQPITAPVPVTSNIGKKILVEFCNDQVGKYTLVQNSDEVDADNNKISVHSDLGKVLMYAKQGEVLIFKEGYIRIVEISNISL